LSSPLAALSARYHRAFNERDFDAWREVFDEDVELLVDGMTFTGVDAALAYGVGSATQFPSLYIGAERIVAEHGDVVVTEIDMVHGDPAGGVSRRQGTVCEICRVRDGRIASVRSYYMAEPADEEEAVRVPARSEATLLAEEQASLRRVATLVARGISENELFDTVSGEIGWLVGADPTSLMRFDADDTITLVAAWSATQSDFPVGATHPVDGELRLLRETGRPLRWGPGELPPSGPFVAEARSLGIRTALGVPIVVDGRVWGVAFACSAAERPFAEDAETRIAAFTELVATAIANAQARAQLQSLAAEQAARERVATLVAHDVAPQELFAAVTAEVGTLLGVDLAGMIRYVGDDALEPVATWAAEGEHPDVGGIWPVEEGTLAARIRASRRPAREEDYSHVAGRIGEAMRGVLGVRSSVSSPIVVNDAVWGGLFVHSKRPNDVLPRNTEARLESFAELVATAISNAEARAAARRLADQQAALRRVATLVARESPADEVLTAVAEEVVRILGVDDARIVRYDADDTVTIVAHFGRVASQIPVGVRAEADGDNVTTMVLRTGRSARKDYHDDATGPIGDQIRQHGIRSSVGGPIFVGRRLWGAVLAASLTVERLPPDAEARIAEFAELVATAISNIEARADLAASRARLVAAGDEERRRVVRDLHDGAQQRLVHTVITLKEAQQSLPPGTEPASALLSDALRHAERTMTELRDLAHGIMPALLTRGGLRAAVTALGSRAPVPVDVDVPLARLPPHIEATAYFVVAEALTNVAKHARAARATVEASIDDDTLRVAVRDDGVGGARTHGSGVLGLADRVAVLGGRLLVDSPEGGGTLVAAEIPIPRG
jgi:signal transduction histidine kinase/ketosteroid isomerase-like protein